MAEAQPPAPGILWSSPWLGNVLNSDKSECAVGEGRLLEACETERERQGVSVSISRDEKEETEEEVVADSALSSM